MAPRNARMKSEYFCPKPVLSYKTGVIPDVTLAHGLKHWAGDVAPLFARSSSSHHSGA